MKTKIGYRGEGPDVGEKGHGVTGTEGDGVYIADTERLAEFFGDVVRVEYIPPKNPLVVDEEPLYLLHEMDELFDPIKPTDSVWTKANKEATKRSGVTDEHWDPDKIAKELTSVIKEWGYDGVRVVSGGDGWTILFDPSAVVKKESIRSEDNMNKPKKNDEKKIDETFDSGLTFDAMAKEIAVKIGNDYRKVDDETVREYTVDVCDEFIDLVRAELKKTGVELLDEEAVDESKVDERGTKIMNDIFRA